jgi:3-isopropylmalate/(R)-2-methylmalate dehydratase large subunit
MNLVEKILARASGRRSVEPGEVIVADVDLMLLHDLSAAFVSRVFREELPGTKLRYPDRVGIVFDHTFSPPTERSAERLDGIRRFAKEHGITHLFDSGSGSMHHVILESGLWAPGQVIIGCDSHTTVYGAFGAFSTGVGNDSMAALGFAEGKAWFRVPERMLVRVDGKTQRHVTARDVSQFLVGSLGEDGAVYKAVEYAGSYIEGLSIEDRLLFPLMAIDVGAKAGYIDPDNATLDYARRTSKRSFEPLRNDPDVSSESVLDIDASKVEPQVAVPPLLSNVVPVTEMEGTAIQLAEIGGSTGGRFCDLEVAAERLSGKHVHGEVRLQIVPATRSIYRRALEEGLLTTLLDAGATIFPPSAGSNQAVNMGAMASDEAMISTQARNFPGRNGSPNARHYLSSAETVAVSALEGRITDPRRAGR